MTWLAGGLVGFGVSAYRFVCISWWFGAAARAYRLACLGEGSVENILYSVFYVASLSCRSLHMTRHSHRRGTIANATQPAQADFYFDEFKPELDAKKDHETEAALWNNRLFKTLNLHLSP